MYLFPLNPKVFSLHLWITFVILEKGVSFFGKAQNAHLPQDHILCYPQVVDNSVDNFSLFGGFPVDSPSYFPLRRMIFQGFLADGDIVQKENRQAVYN